MNETRSERRRRRRTKRKEEEKEEEEEKGLVDIFALWQFSCIKQPE